MEIYERKMIQAGWSGGKGKMKETLGISERSVLEKIYQELVLIRKELQSIKEALEPGGININTIIDRFEENLKELTA